METNNVNRAPAEARPPSATPVGTAPPAQPQLPPRPPLNRVDSRSAFPPQPRPAAPPSTQPPQQRPQFQPGGPVSYPSQFAPRPGTPAPRGPVPTGPPGSQQPQGPRIQAPILRASGPQSFVPQQGPRPQPLPTGQPQRAPIPNTLQFGPRQPSQLGGGTTPDGVKAYTAPVQQPNGVPRNSSTPVPNSAVQLSRQSSQSSIKGSNSNYINSNKQATLDNQSVNIENQNAAKPDAYDMPGAPKNRSYSIAAAPGAPSPLKMEDDRRKSISVVGGRNDDLNTRSSGLGLIQESKIESQENIRGSRESIRPETFIDPGRDLQDRSESRLSTKMSESFIGSLPTPPMKKKIDDDDDVVLQNNVPVKNTLLSKPIEQNTKKVDSFDRSPSLSRSEDSPDLKQQSNQNLSVGNKPAPNQNGNPEYQRPKTPKTPTKQESKTMESNIEPPQMKQTPKTPIPDSKPPIPIQKKPTEFNDSKKSTPRKTASAPRYRSKDGDNDSGVDESTQGHDLNGSPGSPNKKAPSKLPTKEKSNGSLKPLSRSSSKSATAKTPEMPSPAEKKKVPMNKIQVGNAPSPNIKAVKSKIGSLENSTYKPGGGKVKIENRKLDFQNVTPKIAAKNDTYAPSGGTKKIPTAKLEWNAKSKIGSLQNASYKPGGGDKKIETVKLDFKDKAKPKVASTVNITHKPGGGAVKIENQKLEFKVQSKVGSLDNVKHKPKGGDVKIFDDKEYIKQMSQSPAPISRTDSRQESPIPPTASQPPKSDVNLNQQQ